MKKIFILLFATLFGLNLGHAQSAFTWTGGGADGNWTTAANWGGTAPGSPQVFLNFTNSTRLNNTNNFAAGSPGFQIYFKGGAGTGAFNLYGNGINFFDFSSVDPNIQNEGTVSQTINFPITNGSTRVSGAVRILNINGNASPAQGPLVFNSPISAVSDGNARVINVSGAGAVTFNGVISQGATGSNALTQLGSGTTTLAATNTYTGITTINAGSVTVAGSGLLGSGSYAGAIFIASGATFEYAGAITGSGALIKSGALKSDLTLSSTANTYSGNTTITNGRVVATAPSNLSSGATTIVQTNAGQIFFNVANQTFSNPINISSLGYPEGDALNSTSGAVRIEGSTLSGTITLSGNSRIGSSLFSGPTNTISGQITGLFGLDFYGMNLGGASGNRELFVLSNPANNYTGNTTLYNRDYNAAKTLCATTLRLGASGVIPSGASAGNLAFTGADANHLTYLDLYGFNQTINGTTVTAASGARITNSGTAASLLTIGANNTTSTFNGLISDGGPGSANTLAITKTGTGTLILSGTNVYSGATTISAGTLQADNTNTLGYGLLVMNGGTLSNSVTVLLTNNISLAANSIVGVGTSQTLTLGGVITNTGSLTKVGAGSLALTNANNTFSGGITMNSGFLLPASGSVLGTGTIAVNSGATAYPVVTMTITNPLALNGGYLRAGGAGSSVIWSGPVTVLNGFTMSGDTSTTGNRVSGPIDIGTGGIYVTNLNGNGQAQNNFGNSDILSGTISGSGDITYYLHNGNSRLTVYGTNTYSGNTVVNQIGGQVGGKLNVYSGSTATNYPFSTGTVTLNAGAIIEAYPGSATITNALTLNGGTLESESQFNNYNTLTWAGPITLTANSTLLQYGQGALNNNQSSGVTVSGSLNMNGFTLTNTSPVACFNGNIISGSISGAGTILHLINAFVISGSNTFREALI